MSYVSYIQGYKKKRFAYFRHTIYLQNIMFKEHCVLKDQWL